MNDTDTDRVILDGLDFAPPCTTEGLRVYGVPVRDCNAVAAWVVRTQRHCGCIGVRLLCHPHKDWFLEFLSGPPGSWVCSNCERESLAAPRVIGIEPL
jgi:hypothetical protein